MCVACWRAGDGDFMRKRVVWNSLDSLHSPSAYRGVGADGPTPRMAGVIVRGQCGRCLGRLDFVPDSVELCRCAESRHSFSDDRWFR